jgi:transposase
MKSIRDTSKLVQVSRSTVQRWIKDPKRKKYIRKSKILKSDQIEDIINLTINNSSFITLSKLQYILKNNLNIDVSKELIRKIIHKKIKLSYKKAHFYTKPKHLQEKVNNFIIKRNIYLEEKRLLVCIDETSFGRNGIQVYGWSPVGQRLIVRPLLPNITTTAIAAITNDELLDTKIFKGGCNSILFKDFLESLELPEYSVIIMDNASIHRSKNITNYCNSKNINILYTPPYSPWFNGIEYCFSIIKRYYYKNQNIVIQDTFKSLTVDNIKVFYEKAISCTGLD